MQRQLAWADGPQRRRGRESRRRVGRIGLLAVGLALFSGCANPVTDTLIEQPLGALSELAINLQFRMDNDPLLDGYVKQLGAEQKKHVKRTNVPYRFKLVDMEAPNAFAIPWGGVYVTRGLLRFADSEDEIAFVVGHEVGHIERRHSSLAFQRNMLISLGLHLLTNRSNEDWMQFAYIGNHLLDLHWSRTNEHSADREGAARSLLAGYDPGMGLNFFVRLDEQYGRVPRFWSYLSTHPVNRDRINHLMEQPQYSASDPTVLTRIADGYHQRRYYQAAENRYRQALAADPAYGDAHLGLARVAAWRGDITSAKARYGEALRFGVDRAVVEQELQTLEAQPTQPAADEIILASASEVRDLRNRVELVSDQVDRVTLAAAPIWNAPLDGSRGLIDSYRSAGGNLDALYAIRKSLGKTIQDAVVVGQKSRALTLQAVTDVSGAQEEAARTMELLADNKRRLAVRLGGEAVSQSLAATAAVSLRQAERAAAEVKAGSGRLNDLIPEVSSAVKASHETIARLQQSTAGSSGERSQLNRALADRLEATTERTQAAMRLAVGPSNAIYTARARALQSSIEITMVDLPRYQRRAAEAIIERLTLAAPGDLDQALSNGLGYGEAAYALGMSRSSKRSLSEVLTYLQSASPGDSIDRLEARHAGVSGNVDVMLKLIDMALKREFDPQSL